MAEPTQGVRGTKFADATETSLPRDVNERINLLQPDAAPLLIVTASMKKKKVATEAKFEWFEDQLAPNVVTVANTAGTGTAIDVTAGTGKRVRVNDLLATSTGEAILITVIATDSLTVERSKGDVAAATLAIGDELVIVGNAMQEGSSVPTFKYTQKVPKLNYIQIFRDAVQLTDVQSMVKSFGGPDRVYQRMKIGIEHRRSIEQAFLFGDKFEDTSGTQTRRGTGGLLNWISTNITDAGGVITEAEFETFLRGVFRYTPTVNAGTKVAFLSPILISAINAWAKQSLQVTSNEKTYGMRIATYRSGHGDLTLMRHWLLQDFAEYQKYGFVIEPTNVTDRFLDGGGDTKLYIDTQNKGDAVAQDEYRSYKGIEVEQEKTHGLIKGVTGYAA